MQGDRVYLSVLWDDPLIASELAPRRSRDGDRRLFICPGRLDCGVIYRRERDNRKPACRYDETVLQLMRAGF
jgi:hypothetical protein